MDVTAGEPFHLGVTLDDLTEVFAVFEGLKIHVADG